MKKNIPLLLIIFLLPASAFSQELNITNKIIRETNPRSKYEIDVTYPQINFGPDALMGLRGMADDVNNIIDTMINKRINSFRDDTMQTGFDTITKANSLLEMKNAIVNKDHDLLSIRFDIFYYYSGAAHPMTEVRTLNYGFTSTGLLELANLFEPRSNFIELISQYSIRELKDNLSRDGIDDNGWIEQGAGPDIDNFSAWNIGNDTLIIIFNAYQVGPYAIGIQEVHIPFYALRSIINPKGPLSYYRY
jgi:hypothetical protein